MRPFPSLFFFSPLCTEYLTVRDCDRQTKFLSVGTTPRQQLRVFWELIYFPCRVWFFFFSEWSGYSKAVESCLERLLKTRFVQVYQSMIHVLPVVKPKKPNRILIKTGNHRPQTYSKSSHFQCSTVLLKTELASSWIIQYTYLSM